MLTSTRGPDPRKLQDKDFLNASIKTLVSYLVDHNYDQAISPKIMKQPSSKDYHSIIFFLFRQIDPNYECIGTKLEPDEILAFYRQLGYQHPPSKANIAAAGTPHAWPSLLAGLVWLVELLTYDEQAAPSMMGQVWSIYTH